MWLVAGEKVERLLKDLMCEGLGQEREDSVGKEGWGDQM